MKAKTFSILMAAVLLCSVVAQQAMAADTSKESFKERWDNGVQHTESRTKEIVKDTGHSAKRIGNDIKDDTKRVGHRLSKEAHRASEKLHDKDKE